MVCTKAGIKIPQALKASSSQSSEAVFGYQSQREGALSILKKSSSSGGSQVFMDTHSLDKFVSSNTRLCHGRVSRIPCETEQYCSLVTATLDFFSYFHNGLILFKQ